MEKLNIAIVGLRFGSTVIEELLEGECNPYFHVYAVCDLDPSKVDDSARKYGAKPYYSMESLLADPEIQVVGLYTPPAGRAELIDQIMSAGRDVITTKPFELSPQKALDILTKAIAMKRVVHLNSPGPVWHETLTYIKAWTAKYELGIPIGGRWDIWVNYREKADGGWYDDPERCPVAPIFRLGIYIINDMVRIFGPVHKVSTLSSRLITERPTVDNSQVSLLFRNGAIANIFGSFCVDDSQRYKSPMILNFEYGTFYCDVMPTNEGDANKLLLVACDPITKQRITEEVEVTGDAGRYQWEAFYESVCERKMNEEAYIHDVVEGLKIIEAMQRSESRGTVEVVREVL
ncbi:Predicted dehydrogenase [Paenibacillus sp. 1_12]|uniref:Gfo/Idh/MocA family protein n=1 Tax=Paenibacillus sp. 1_12 TaxID=1566278 RepID=UPI0008EBAE48|nr:Gfo/Idh/MocA family oxidoreductase [Paenibacillus sp. 1_12]SFL57255.1 Predicted dehydrogenase [Paenibacillus sp. 1_12]